MGRFVKDADDRESGVAGMALQGGAQLVWPRYLALCAVGLVLALTWIGPSASEGLGGARRVLFWAAHVMPAIVLLAGTQMGFARMRRLSGLPGLAR